MNTEYFQKKLEKELGELEAELRSVGQINPDNPQDWEAKPADMDILKSDSNEVADNIEEFEENSAILKQLEIRLNEVKAALKKIKEGKFGKCEVGGEPIEADRLEANPAAATCKKHVN